MGWGQRLRRRRSRATINRVLLKIPANFRHPPLQRKRLLFLSKNFLQNFGFTTVNQVIRLSGYDR